MNLCQKARRIGFAGVGIAMGLAGPSFAARADAPKTRSAPAPPPALELKIKTSPYRPSVGASVTINATVSSVDTSASTTGGKRVVSGLFLVRDDLGGLFFEEPTEKDETFQSVLTLPSGGQWRVFGSVATEGDTEGPPPESIVGPVTLTVDGARPLRASLIPQMMPFVRTGSYSLSLGQPTRITTGDTQRLIFTLVDNQSQQVSDMDLWRGALAHLVLVDRDLKTLIHVTPDASDPRTGRTGTLVFPTRFPKSGIWRGWVLFYRGAQVVTLPLVLRVLGR
ncbi:MAG: hypothetical protein H7Z41_04565 [Cytophagales bacterium]|nr:hypothetical protein [Armatimonadota bacterium]